MSENSKFDVYTGKFIPAIGVPVVLITGEKDSGVLYSECYIFLPDEIKKGYYSLMFKCPAFFKNTDLINIDIDYMMKIALDAAQGEITTHIFNKYNDSNTLFDFDLNIELKNSKPTALLQLYIENKFRKEIEDIRNKSISKKLRDYLISVLPILINIDFSSQKISN